ncbi:hypothetical protein AA11826_2080 [Komagataeibacter oboediens DSM 11826]|nr:hypothetical protein AA11826_2080 [Komagataeibacter oboediens DSM 11826]
MQFFKHVTYAFVTFVTSPDVCFAHAVDHWLPSIATGYKDHQRE